MRSYVPSVICIIIYNLFGILVDNNTCWVIAETSDIQRLKEFCMIEKRKYLQESEGHFAPCSAPGFAALEHSI